MNERSDYYSVDFREEKSALSGHIMWRQTIFVNAAIEAILSRYPPHMVFVTI
jgi:hypothetical protein